MVKEWQTAQAFVAQFGEQVDGLVLVDPAPAEYTKYVDDATDRFPYEGSGDFGDRPLVVIGHDMSTTFRSAAFIASQGEARSEEMSTIWQEVWTGMPLFPPTPPR